jgi:hypothetical protein
MGGWAAIAHGLPRSTFDVDIYAQPTLENIRKLASDIFTRPAGLEAFEECWDRRLEREFESVSIPFLGSEDLIRSKQTGREQDRADIEALRELQKKNNAK